MASRKKRKSAKPKDTVTVRIAVAVDSDGEYGAYAMFPHDDDPSVVLGCENVLDQLGRYVQFAVVTAEIPRPRLEVEATGKVKLVRGAEEL